MPWMIITTVVTLLSTGVQPKDVVTHAPCWQAHPMTSITQTQGCDSGHYPVSPIAETPSHCGVTQLGKGPRVSLWQPG